MNTTTNCDIVEEFNNMALLGLRQHIIPRLTRAERDNKDKVGEC